MSCRDKARAEGLSVLSQVNPSLKCGFFFDPSVVSWSEEFEFFSSSDCRILYKKKPWFKNQLETLQNCMWMIRTTSCVQCWKLLADDIWGTVYVEWRVSADLRIPCFVRGWRNKKGITRYCPQFWMQDHLKYWHLRMFVNLLPNFICSKRDEEPQRKRPEWRLRVLFSKTWVLQPPKNQGKKQKNIKIPLCCCYILPDLMMRNWKRFFRPLFYFCVSPAPLHVLSHVLWVVHGIDVTWHRFPLRSPRSFTTTRSFSFGKCVHHCPLPRVQFGCATTEATEMQYLVNFSQVQPLPSALHCVCWRLRLLTCWSSELHLFGSKQNASRFVSQDGEWLPSHALDGLNVWGTPSRFWSVLSPDPHHNKPFLNVPDWRTTKDLSKTLQFAPQHSATDSLRDCQIVRINWCQIRHLPKCVARQWAVLIGFAVSLLLPNWDEGMPILSGCDPWLREEGHLWLWKQRWKMWGIQWMKVQAKGVAQPQSPLRTHPRRVKILFCGVRGQLQQQTSLHVKCQRISLIFEVRGQALFPTPVGPPEQVFLWEGKETHLRNKELRNVTMCRQNATGRIPKAFGWTSCGCRIWSFHSLFFPMKISKLVADDLVLIWTFDAQRVNRKHLASNFWCWSTSDIWLGLFHQQRSIQFHKMNCCPRAFASWHTSIAHFIHSATFAPLFVLLQRQSLKMSTVRSVVLSWTIGFVAPTVSRKSLHSERDSKRGHNHGF